MKIPPQGLSFEQVCQMAVDKGVYVLVGCHKDNVGKHPATVSVQIQDASGKKNPIAFSFEMIKMNPRSNQALCHLVMLKVEEMRPSPMKLIL